MADDKATLSRRKILLGALGAAAGCARQRRIPPLADLYADMARAPRPPLIVIPGAFGSQLTRRSTGQEIWPGSNLSLLFSSYRDIAVAIDPRTLEPAADDVEPTGLFLAAFGRDFYAALLRTLETAGGYESAAAVAPASASERSYYVYDYDWRLDIVAGARGLHELIERVAQEHGGARGRVDVLAHSSGGLIARYYARYGTADALGEHPPDGSNPGSDRIRRLLLVGTPNLGTIQAVLSHVRGEEVGLRHIPPEVVATCPGATQLMPEPGHAWLANLVGDTVHLDAYDIDTWRQLGWSIFSDDARDRIVRERGSERAADEYLELLEAYLARHLERGRRLHAALAAPARPDEPRPYVFGGDCLPTLARLVVELDGGTYRCHEQADHIPRPVADVDYGALMNEPGDGVVTRSSLIGRPGGGRGDALELAQSVFLCAPHQTLTANLSFQDNLLYALLHQQEA